MDKSFTLLSVMIPLASLLLGAIVSYFSITFFENKKVKWALNRVLDFPAFTRQSVNPQNTPFKVGRDTHYFTYLQSIVFL